MKVRSNLLLCFAAALSASQPCSAHHSFEAEYDIDKPLQVTGVVTRVEWMNPHVRFYIEATGEAGATVNWNIELGSPLLLRRLGWKPDSLKEGEQVTVQGYRAKDGAHMANAKKVTLSDGRQVFGGSSADARPNQ